MILQLKMGYHLLALLNLQRRIYNIEKDICDRKQCTEQQPWTYIYHLRGKTLIRERELINLVLKHKITQPISCLQPMTLVNI